MMRFLWMSFYTGESFFTFSRMIASIESLIERFHHPVQEHVPAGYSFHTFDSLRDTDRMAATVQAFREKLQETDEGRATLESRYRSQCKEIPYASDLSVLVTAVAEGEVIGIAEARMMNDPCTVDTGFMVAPEHQGKGIGKALFYKLYEECFRRGFQTFHLDICGKNSAMRSLVAPVYWQLQQTEISCYEDELSLDLPLSEEGRQFLRNPDSTP